MKMSRSLDKWFRASMRVLLASLTVLIVVSAAMAQAQSNAADLQGTVRDPNGAVVPNASSTARNTGTNIARDVTSNDDGYYKIVNLPPGNYEVTVKASNYKTAIIPSVKLTVGQTINQDIPLELGELSATVTVTSVAPSLVETTNTTIASVVDQQRIENLPINARNMAARLAATSTKVRRKRYEAVSLILLLCLRTAAASRIRILHEQRARRTQQQRDHRSAVSAIHADVRQHLLSAKRLRQHAVEHGVNADCVGRAGEHRSRASPGGRRNPVRGAGFKRWCHRNYRHESFTKCGRRDSRRPDDRTQILFVRSGGAIRNNQCRGPTHRLPTSASIADNISDNRQDDVQFISSRSGDHEESPPDFPVRI